MFSKINKYLGRLDIKLTIYNTLIILFLASVLTGFFIYRLQRSLIKQVDRVLRDEARELILEWKEEADIITGSSGYEEDTSNRKHFPVFFRILNASGEILYISKNASIIPFPTPKNKKKYFSTFKIPEKKYPFRLYEKKISMNNSSYLTLQISTETTEYEKILENLDDNILIAMIVTIFLSIGSGMLASRKPRKIISNITKVTNRITTHNLNERLPVPSTHDEIYNLTDTINSMLNRLEKSFKEIKQFTSDVSHELRNPIFAIKGEMEVALSQKRTDKEYRDVIQECSERVDFINKMINDLFLISRFELKKIDLDLIYLNLSEILNELYDFFLPIAQQKNLNFIINRCDDVLINGDRTRIHQLFSNLLDNAIKFTPKNGSVILSLISQNNTTQFIVKDSGIGIPEIDTPYIFNRFYQVDKSRSESSRGTGLGLHICKRIVEAHGGNIIVERNSDQGVTFTVTLPKLQ